MMTDAEYKAYCEERNAAFKAKYGREMTYEDAMKSWGSRFVGESIVEPWSDEIGRPVYKGIQS